LKAGWIILAGLSLALVLGLLVWLASSEGGNPLPSVANTTQPATQPADSAALRLALVPERDVFALRRSYETLAQDLSSHLERPVDLVTLNTYESVLDELRERRIEGAFLGSMVALLAMDRCGARVLVRPERPDGVSTYRGVICVLPDSPIRSLDELRGKSIAMVKTTYAGSLFPLSEIARRGWLRDALPRILWVGTHEDVIREVLAGRAEVGAVKDLVLNDFEKTHPQVKLRRLATSKPVPNNALLLRGDVANRIGPALTDLLLDMHEIPCGRRALAALGAKRFIPCHPSEYEPIFDMIDLLGPDWNLAGVAGSPPRRAILTDAP
jgi:phosphonate transport system substrate-binding protein